MYIHIGGDLDIPGKDIIAILDWESVRSVESVEAFLQQNSKDVLNLSKKSIKSIVITVDKIYLSPLASGTLKKRSNAMNMQEY